MEINRNQDTTAVEQETIAQGSLPEKQPAVLVTHWGGDIKDIKRDH